jgi:hypothetical protein
VVGQWQGIGIMKVVFPQAYATSRPLP